MEFKNKLKGKFLIIFFITILYLPIIGLIFNFQNGLYDPRLGNTKAFPEFKNYSGDIGKFCDDFFEYYEDNFGFRHYFMKFASGLKIKLFKTYPKNIDVKVLKGKDGWLFYKLGNELEDFQGRVPLGRMTLNNLISEYEDTLHRLNNAGIQFYVLIPPDKSVIYSEYMPDKALYGIKSDKTRISQLLALNSDFIYPKKELLDNKGEDLLYFKTDTHWTFYGAYFGYKALMDRIGKDFNIKSFELSNMKKDEHVREAPDLANMVDVGTQKTEIVPEYQCDKEVRKSDLRVIIYGDSFLEFLRPYMNCTFEKVMYMDVKNFDKNSIKWFKPDIVILEIVQRNLRHMFD